MNSKFYLGLLVACAYLLAGCGGSGSNASTPVDGISVSGGLTPTSGNSASDLAISDSERSVTLQVGGVSQEVILPPTVNVVTAGQAIWVLPTSTPIFQNLSRSASALTRAPGDLIINGQLMQQVTLDAQGKLTRPLGLPVGRYTFTLEGPWSFKTGTSQLDSQLLTLSFDVSATGIGFPKSIAGNLPANGGLIKTDQSLTVQVSDAFSGTTVKLDVLKSTGNISQSLTLTGTSGTFKDIAGAGQAAQIPSTGVDEIILTQGTSN